jgi:beta-glucanase (GH16 family)
MKPTGLRRLGLVLLVVAVHAALLLPVGPPRVSDPLNRAAGLATAEAATPKPRGVGGQWRLVFWDGFGGTKLKTGNWQPNWLGKTDRTITKPVNSAELSCYDPRNVRVSGGTLKLRAERRSCRDNRGRTYRYASGLVNSSKDFRFSYGYAEARVYLPPSKGRQAPRGSCGPNWPAFWLNGTNWRTDGEIDVFECLSGNDVAWHYHHGTTVKYSAGGYPAAWRDDMPGSSGWHTFGVDWAPGRAVFYYDGKRVGTQSTRITGRPHYLVLNLGVSGPEVAVPQTMQVEYVRVWKRR